MNVLVFDIETIPDVDSGRRLYRLDGLNDHDVAMAGAVFDTTAETAVCPACGCSFPTSHNACPDCGLCFA